MSPAAADPTPTAPRGRPARRPGRTRSAGCRPCRERPTSSGENSGCAVSPGLRQPAESAWPVTGSIFVPSWRTVTWTCGNWARPEAPISPSFWPRATWSPGFTTRLPCRMWQYWTSNPSPSSTIMPLPHSLLATPARSASEVTRWSGTPSRDSQHRAVGHRQHRHAARHVGHRHDPEIGAVMAVIGGGAAIRIGNAGACIHVGILLDEAVLAQRALRRKAELDRRRRRGKQHCA